jgi:hypothetical protein
MGLFNKNLLVNGGAESGTLTGWTQDPAGWTAATDATHGDTSPLGGNEYFFPPNGASGNIQQEIDPKQRGNFSDLDLDSEILTVVAGGNIEILTTDTGQIFVDYLDINSGVIASYKSPLANSEIWVQHKDTRIIPSGTRFINFKFEAIRNDGTQNNAYLDNAFIVLMSGGLGNNLIINPGAEEGTDANQGPGIYGWHSNNFDITAAITPRTGSFEFGGGAGSDTEPATPKTITQSIDITKFNIESGLIDAGLLKCTAKVFQSSFTDGEDEGQLKVEYLDNSSGVLDQFDGMFFAPRNAPWVPQEDTKQIPANTRFIDITLTAERHAGVNNDGYFDDVSVIIESGQVSTFSEPLFVEKSIPFVAASDNTWGAIDLTAPPFNLPNTDEFVVQIAMMNSDTAGARLLGVRTLGSSLNRTIDVNSPKTDTTGWEMYSAHAQTTSGQIEVLAEVASVTKFVLLGYWKRGTYVELRSGARNTPSTNSVWEQRDLAPLSVSGSVAEIVCCNDDIIADRLVGVRQIGSTQSRTRNIHEALNGNTCYATHVNTSGSNFTIDHFSSDIADTSINIFGYWSDLPANSYTELIENTIVPSGDNVWQNVGFGGVPSGTDIIIECLHKNAVVNNNATVGSRRIGSKHIRAFNHSEAEDGGITALTVNTQASLSGIQVFSDDISAVNNTIGAQGFWSGLPPLPPSGEISLFLENKQSTGTISLFIDGLPGSGEMDLFVGGKPSGEIDLFIDGVNVLSGDMTLFVAGLQEIPLFTKGKPSGEIDQFIQGHVQFNAFAKVEDGTRNNDTDLFIYGGSGGQFAIDSLSLSISGSNTQTKQWPAFAKVAAGTTITSGTVSWPAFAKVEDNTFSTSMSLFINAGPNISNNIPLFIKGAGTTAGAVPVSGVFPAFAKVVDGAIDSVPLFINGFSFPNLPLFMSGSIAIESGNLDLFINGFFLSSSGEISLVMPNTISDIEKQTSLYINGGGC